MKAGETCKFESFIYVDEVTGKEVRRITPPEFRSHHQYFYLNMWTPDSLRVLISSNREDGVYRHYLVHVEAGEAVCLTDTEGLSTHFGELAHDGSHLLYVAGPEFRRLDLGDLTGETVYTRESPWKGSVYYGATADHSRAIMVEMHEEDALKAKEGWDVFEEQWKKKPRCRLVELDLAAGKSSVVHEDRLWLGHPNYRPDGRTIMFCHEGPWHLVDSRLWLIDPDGRNLREGRKRSPDRPAGSDGAELWGHEWWLADSSRAAYVFFDREYGSETTVRLLDPETLAEEVLMPVSGYSHPFSNRESTMLVGDGHPPGSDLIYVADLARREEKVLCRHGSSCRPYVNERTGRPNTQEVHPHPCFSPDGRRVVFTSDVHGEPAVYVVEV